MAVTQPHVLVHYIFDTHPSILIEAPQLKPQFVVAAVLGGELGVQVRPGDGDRGPVGVLLGLEVPDPPLEDVLAGGVGNVPVGGGRGGQAEDGDKVGEDDKSNLHVSLWLLL